MTNKKPHLLWRDTVVLLLNKLEKLGNGFMIAEYFESQQIKGKRNSPLGDPIANYLIANGVEHPFVTLGSVIGNIGHDRMVVPMHGAVAEFRRQFDQGDYPNLEISDATS